MRSKATRLALGVLTYLAISTASLRAADQKSVTFDYTQSKDGTGQRLALQSGEKFTVTVTNIPADKECKLDVTGIQAPESTTLQKGKLGDATQSKDMVHDSSFGGYYVTVTCKDPAAFRRWLIFAKDTGWNAAFAGGFTISTLTNRVFETRADTRDGQTVQVVSEDEDKRSKVRLGLAAMVHVYADKVSSIWTPLTFGLGLNQDSQVSYFVGSGIRLGDKGFISLGANFGPVSRLPDGVRLGDVVSNPNALNNLPTRTVVGGFFALSYTFIDVKSLFEKPFATKS